MNSQSRLRPPKTLVLSAIVVFAVLALSQTAYAGNGKFKNGKFDFCVSVRFNATPAQLDRIKSVFDLASFILFDATDGNHQFGTITIVNNSGAGTAADFWIHPGSGNAYSSLNLFGFWGQHATLFYDSDFADINKTEVNAHTVVHEFGHLAYNLYDEYKGLGAFFIPSAAECAPPGSDTPTLNYCIMDAYAHRGLALTNPLEISLNEFCSASNHDRAAPGNPGSANNTYQHFFHGQSCWQTIASHPKWSIPAPDPPMETGGSATPADFQTGTLDQRFMLLVDRSGSMLDDSKMTFAKLAANQFITYASDGMELGVASFADSGILNFFLTPISESNRASAFSAVNALQASGATNIGHGLQIALAEIEAQTEDCCTQAIILISDGDHNIGTHPDAVIPALVDAKVAVFTIGIGSAISASGEATLQNLSKQTGGRYYRVNNSALISLAILNILFHDALTGGPTAQAPTFITTGQVIEVPVTVEQGATRVAFMVNKTSSADSITLSLRTPSGQIITPNDGAGSNPRHRVDAFTHGFQIFSPAPGTWTMIITAGTISNGNLNVRAWVEHDGSKLSAFVKNDLATYPQPLQITAIPEWEGQRVVGATVTGKVVHPQGMNVPITLFDDGGIENGDEIPGDGVYSANFNYVEQFGSHYRNGVPIAGSYTIELTMTNTNGTKYPGEVELYPDPPSGPPSPVPPFTRLASTTAIVANVPTDTTAPSCQATSCSSGPPASCDLTVQDTGVGLSLINVISTNNVNLTIPSFTGGTTSPVIVTGTLVNPNSNGSFEIQSVDVRGNSSSCSRTVTAAAPAILSDDFNDNSIDTTKWLTQDMFTMWTNLGVPITETAQQLQIGPLLQIPATAHRGVVTASVFNFTGANSYVELVQGPSSTTDAEASFAVGNNPNRPDLTQARFYRIYVKHGTLFGERRTSGTVKTTLFSIPYDPVAHRFWRIRHNAGSVTLDTAPGSGGVPGTWVQRFTQTWHSAIPVTSVLIEFRGGTATQQTNPGTVIFDNFVFALNGP